MLLRNKETGEEFHTPSGLGKALIASGVVEEVLPLPEPELEVKWSVSQGPVHGDYQYPPAIFWSAGSNNGHCESFKGTAHLSVRVYVPGLKAVTCPSHIAQEYVRLFNQWAAKSKKRKDKATGELVPAVPTETVSAHTAPAPKGAAWKGVMSSPWRNDVELRNK